MREYANGFAWLAPKGTDPRDTYRFLFAGWVHQPAREELRYRLNQRLKGKDLPGPVNWKGI